MSAIREGREPTVGRPGARLLRVIGELAASLEAQDGWS